jgi:hypothetical protein
MIRVFYIIDGQLPKKERIIAYPPKAKENKDSTTIFHFHNGKLTESESLTISRNT